MRLGLSTFELFNQAKEMKVLQFMIIVLCALKEFKAKIVMNDDQDSVIPQYVSALVHQAKEFDRSRTHDVVLIRLENEMKSEMFDTIVKQVVNQNPDNPIMTIESGDEISKRCTHAASFIIIVSDITNPVRTMLNPLFLS